MIIANKLTINGLSFETADIAERLECLLGKEGVHHRLPTVEDIEELRAQMDGGPLFVELIKYRLGLQSLECPMDSGELVPSEGPSDLQALLTAVNGAIAALREVNNALSLYQRVVGRFKDRPSTQPRTLEEQFSAERLSKLLENKWVYTDDGNYRYLSTFSEEVRTALREAEIVKDASPGAFVRTAVVDGKQYAQFAFVCMDCGFDDHCVLLKGPMWRKITADTNGNGFLCPTCMEARLGRRITPSMLIGDHMYHNYLNVRARSDAWARMLGRPTKPRPKLKKR